MYALLIVWSTFQLMDQSTLELQNNVDILFETRFEMGYTKPTLSMDTSDVADMLQVVSYHIAVESCRSELDQLAEGLQLFGFLEKARAHPGRMSCLLEVGQSQLTADSLYATIESRLSDVGTNARAQEEAVRVNFNSFLLDVEGNVYALSNNILLLLGHMTYYVTYYAMALSVCLFKFAIFLCFQMMMMKWCFTAQQLVT